MVDKPFFCLFFSSASLCSCQFFSNSSGCLGFFYSVAGREIKSQRWMEGAGAVCDHELGKTLPPHGIGKHSNPQK